MAALKKVKHVVTIGTEKYSVRLADIYGSFGGATGIVKAPANDTTNYTDKIEKEEYSEGKVVKLKARASTGTAPNVKYKDFTIHCIAEKQKSALANLDSKTITIGNVTWDIQSVRIPGRRRFS